MRWARFFLLVFLVPCLINAAPFYDRDYLKVIEKISVEWKRHEDLLQQFGNLTPEGREQGMGLLQEAIVCCQNGIGQCEYIIKRIDDKRKEERRDEYWVSARKQTKQMIKMLNNEITSLQGLIQSTAAFSTCRQLCQESEQKAALANLKYQNCPRLSKNVEEVVSTYNEAAKLCEEAYILAQQALQVISPYPDEANKSILMNAIAAYQDSANRFKNEAALCLAREEIKQWLAKLYNKNIAEEIQKMSLEEKQYKLFVLQLLEKEDIDAFEIGMRVFEQLKTSLASSESSTSREPQP